MILAAALATGGAEYALDITVQYSEAASSSTSRSAPWRWRTTWPTRRRRSTGRRSSCTRPRAHSVGKPLARLAPMAKLFACNTYRDTTAMAQQIFGGVGFTLEYEIQLYFRRAKQLQLSWNDTRRCEDLIAAAVLDGEGDDEAA